MQMNLYTEQRPRDIENKFMITQGGRDKLEIWN